MGGSGRIWIVNGLCVLLLALGVSRLRQDWTAFATNHQVSLLTEQPDRTAVPPAAAAPAAVNEAWTDILARHPFSFDRNDISFVPAVIETPKVTPPKPVLFGVVDLGSGRTAMLGDPGARRSSKAVKVGEAFKAWTVTKIEARSIVVQSEGLEETLELGNAPVDREGGKTAATSTPVATTSTAPATSSAPAPASAPAVGLPPGTPVVAPPGTRVVQTPFGPVVEQVP